MRPPFLRRAADEGVERLKAAAREDEKLKHDLAKQLATVAQQKHAQEVIGPGLAENWWGQNAQNYGAVQGALGAYNLSVSTNAIPATSYTASSLVNQ